MKSILQATMVLLFAGLLIGTTGCANRYRVTLNNGTKLDLASKPKLNDNGEYVYKDIDGTIRTINAMRVRSIEVK